MKTSSSAPDYIGTEPGQAILMQNVLSRFRVLQFLKTDEVVALFCSHGQGSALIAPALCCNAKSASLQCKVTSYDDGLHG